MGTSKHKAFIRALIYTQTEEKIDVYDFCAIPAFIVYRLKNDLSFVEVNNIFYELVQEELIAYEKEGYRNALRSYALNLYMLPAW